MLGTMMFCSRVLMAVLPNIHLIGVLTIAYTAVYRARALFPLYIYIMMEGLYAGFATWWWPYLYVWTVLWGITMLLPRHMPKQVARVVYPIICTLHGAFFGVLYAPGQALLYGLTFQEMLAWIAAGLTFDLLHTVGNFAAGLLIYPLVRLLFDLSRKSRII